MNDIDKTLKLRKQSMNIRASGASELRIFSYFHLLKLHFLQYFVGTSDILSQKHFPFITCMILYTNDSIPTKH